MEIANQSWKEIGEAEIDIALLPTGSTEQHGPHMALSTDTKIAERIAKKTAEKTEAAVLPPVPVGIAEEHRYFPGTLFIKPDTFRAVVTDTLNSASNHGFNAAIIVNGHGGNIDALDEVSSALQRRGDIWTTPWTWFEAIETDELGHGGKEETSLMKYLSPELIDDDRLERGVDSWGEYIESAPTTYDVENFTQNGVVGDPETASSERGDYLFNESVNSLSRLVEWIRENEPWKN